MSTGAAAKVETIRTAEITEHRVPLAQLLAGAPEGQEPVPGFPGWFEGSAYEVTAVLERTCALQSLTDPAAEKLLKRHELVLVAPGAVDWRPKSEKRDGRMDRETQQARAAYFRGLREEEASLNAWRFSHEPPRPGVGGPAALSDRVCSRGGCGKRLHPANASGECHGCQRICPVCGGPKGANSQTCSGCGSRGGRPRRTVAAIPEPADATPALRSEIAAALAAPPSRDELLPAVVVLAPADAAPPPPPTPITTADAVPPLTLDQLPDYVGRLLTQIDRLLERVQEQDAEIAALRARETAWMDVERRVQAVVAHSERRS